MAVIGTFGSFTAARLGIYASQASLNVTGNNISNINTKGYTRQRMDLVSLHSAGSARYANSYNLDIGYGVIADSVSQLRDPFLDIRYRDEQSRLGEAETRLDGLNQLAHILDEVGKGDGEFGIVEAQFNDFLAQLEVLHKNAGDGTNDTIVRSSAESLVRLLNNYATAMDSAKETMMEDLKDKVSSVNNILTQIRDLNVAIREAGIYHQNALELRDERNVLIDDLSKYIKIDVRYSMEKLDEFSEVEKLSISIADSGNPPIELINGIYGAQLEMPEKTAMRNPAYDPSKPEFCRYISRNSDLNAFPPVIRYTDNEREALEDTNRNKITNDDAGEAFLLVDGITITLPQKHDPDVNGKYLKTNPDGTKTTTDNQEDADLVNNAVKGADDNRLWMQVTALVDERGRYIKDKYGNDIDEIHELGDTALTGSLQALRELLTEEGEFSSAEDIAFDSDANTKRGIPYYEHALDALAKRFADEFNKANQLEFDQMKDAYVTAPDPAGGTTEVFVDANGQPIQIDDPNNPGTKITLTKDYFDKAKAELEKLKADYDAEPDPQKKQELNEQIKQLENETYSAMETLRQEGKLTEAYRYYNGGVLFSNHGDNNDGSNITAKNISISKGWATEKVRLLNTKQPWDEEDHSTLQDNIDHMITMMQTTKWSFYANDVVPDADEGDKDYFKGTFQELLAKMNLTLGNDQRDTGTLYNSYAITSLSRDNDRQSVSGVDLNDEATSMMIFQKSYSAACQLITTLDSMLDKLINGTIR